MIDTHVHFWRYSARDYAWIGNDQSALRQDFMPDDLAPLLGASSVTGCIAVEARASLEETRFLLDLADRHEWIEGVVGWVDLESADLPRVLERLAAHPKLCGVRHSAQDERDPNFLMRPDIVRGISRLEHFDLSFELLVKTAQLPAAIELVRALPNQRFVLDHLGKPEIAKRTREPWTSLLRELALSPNVTAKVSGLVTEAGPLWKRDDCAYYVETALAAFGRERLTLGSDWPVCTVVADHASAIGLARELCGV